MTGQRVTGVALAIIVLLCAACTVTEMDYNKTIGSSSGSEKSASRHDKKRDKKEEATDNYVQLGLGYLRKGDRQRSRANLLKALERDDTSAAAHNGLALIFQLEDETALAEEHYKKAISFEPELTRVRNNYGVFLFRQKRYEDAEKQFIIASEDINYPRRANILFSIGQIAKQLKKPDEAKQAWEKAIKLNPDLSGPFIELADVYFKSGQYPKAKRYLERYEKLSKPSPRALWLAVRLEHAFGNKDGVASKALALKNMFPYSEEALEYKAWLKAGKKGVASLSLDAGSTPEYKDLSKTP